MRRLSFFFALIVISCTPAIKESGSVDSTQVATDTTTTAASDVQQIPEAATQADPDSYRETPAPPTIYPELISTPFTEDAREAAVVGPLFELLRQYDSDKYSELSGTYELRYEEEVGPYDTEDVIENQTRTWYFDSLSKLKCYIKEYEFHGSNGGHPPSKKTIYLFSNDSLIVVYSDQVDQFGMRKISTRAVAGLPKGCVVLTEHQGEYVDSRSYYELTELDSSELAKLSDTFFEEYRVVLQELKKSKRPEGDGDPYTFTMERGTGDRSFSEEFMLGAEVYNKVVAK